jgi:tousled-like kinase
LSSVFFFFFFRRQEEVATEREEIDRQKKLLLKKRPSNETGRKRLSNCQTNSIVPSSPSSVVTGNSGSGTNNNTMHNGIDHGIFLKPDALTSNTLSWQEYYEADEILKVRKITCNFFSK